MLLGGANTGVNIAMTKVAAAKKVVFIPIGAGGASLTNEDCTAYSVHYVYDTVALANGTATIIVKNGGRTWFYLTADYAFGTQLQNATSKVVEANGGKNVGAVRVPLSAADFSSFLLQAQGSGVQVLGLANAGDDFNNSLKAANEFGITRTMQPAGLLVFIHGVHSPGLQVSRGLVLTTAWYWDLNDETRAFSKRLFEKIKKHPTMTQAGRKDEILHQLQRTKSFLWHGNVLSAEDTVVNLLDDIDGVLAELDDVDRENQAVLKRLSRALTEFNGYIVNNRSGIPNYGERYRCNERISTGFVESTINQLVAKRMVKKQQMRWTPRGVHLLLQVRANVLNDDLAGAFRRCVPRIRWCRGSEAGGLTPPGSGYSPIRLGSICHRDH